jgi:Ca2+-binding RTX toxin-like protein
VVEVGGAGIDLIRSSVNRTLGANIENLTLIGAAISGTGNSLNNVMVGSNGANIMRGLRGVDMLLGNGGNDRLDGGFGNDRMTGGSGNDTYFVDSTGDRAIEGLRGGTDIVFSAVTFTLGPYVENLALISGAIDGTGNGLGNVITGNDTKNILRGLGGDDVMFGREGKDVLVGGSGNDTYIAVCPCDTFVEVAGEGTDLVRSSVTFSLGPTPHIENLTLIGADAINGSGNGTDNVITGNGSNNRLEGFEGADTLAGGAGADVVVGGAGRDRLAGGAGADIFCFNSVGDSPASGPSPTATDTILDFSQIDLDRMDLSAIDADTTSGNESFTFVGTNAFSGAAGELRYEPQLIAGIQFTLVEADINGDQDADMHMLVRGELTLADADFVL